MKLRIVAAAALLVCALYGCGNNTSTTSSLYTPAPVTPRPTFDTTHYRTKEEMKAKVAEDFVITSQAIDQSYPTKESEYYTEFTEVADKKTKQIVNNSDLKSDKNKLNNITNNLQSSSFDTNKTINVGVSQNTVSFVTPQPQPTKRPANSIPAGFTSTNYPYSVYSYDGRTYLGDITLKEDNENSIWNVSGQYGSPDSLTSIFNSYGIYGSDNSMFSAFNNDASYPPIIFDANGNSIGVLSNNSNFENGISAETLKNYIEKNGL